MSAVNRAGGKRRKGTPTQSQHLGGGWLLGRPSCYNGRLTNTGRGAEPGKGSGQWDRSDDWAVWIVLLLILAFMDR